MKAFKRTMMIMTVCTLALVVMCGCNSAANLREGFEETEVVAKAEELIDLLHFADYEGAEALLLDEVKEVLAAEILETTFQNVYISAGAFKEYKSTAVVGQENPETKEYYVVAVIVAEYENGNLTYTISMDKDMNISGLYVK